MRAHLYSRVAVSIGVLATALVASPLLLGLRPALGSFCLFQYFFGIPCPGCGITRSLVFLSHLQLGEAFAVNPAGYAVALAIVVPFVLVVIRARQPLALCVLRATDIAVSSSVAFSWLAGIAVRIL